MSRHAFAEPANGEEYVSPDVGLLRMSWQVSECSSSMHNIHPPLYFSLLLALLTLTIRAYPNFLAASHIPITAHKDIANNLALNGWHRGERLAREKLGFDGIPSTAMLWSHISGEMPDQHATFYTTRLPFVPVCILDDEGRPWGSILAGKDGKPGFIHHPRYNTLSIDAQLWNGDPFLHILKASPLKNHSPLIAGIGVEISTRRRNKFAGNITKTDLVENSLKLELAVSEALGNCPKYITLRELAPYPHASPVVIEQKYRLEVGERISLESITFILESDTVFFGTTYAASAQESGTHPSHLGMNHRGGRPGFIRVKQSDGRTVVLPDFSGNRFMTSLGNVEATPLASLTFISFTTGDILYLTGNARNIYGDEARAIMPLQNTLTEIFVTGYTYVRNAFPARLESQYHIQGSPYSPPIRLLAEEATESRIFSLEQQPTALLTRIIIHTPTIATFVWESSIPLTANPGQAIILDFRSLLGSRRYQHMSPSKPSLVNDDFIRTWTISSAAPQGSDSKSFSLTIREQPGGTVTGAMFNIVRKLQQFKPEILDDATDLEFKASVVGVSGDFVLPRLGGTEPIEHAKAADSRRLIWIAGGIGITPFLSMLSAISLGFDVPASRIIFAISTREVDVTLSLIASALGQTALPSYISIHIFTHAPQISQDSGIVFTQHKGRIRPAVFYNQNDISEQRDTEFYLCGPQPFESSIMESLDELGVAGATIHRENFTY